MAATNKYWKSRWLRGPLGGIKYDRQIRWWAGYDCRVECEHEKKGNHGQAGDRFALVVRLRGPSDAALDLLCRASARDGQICSPDRARERGLVTTVCASLHCTFPITEGEVLAGEPWQCDILRGGYCYGTEGSGCWGDRLWTPAQTEAAGDAILHIPSHADVLFALPIWDQMAKELVDALVRHKAESDALPRRCEHCKGKGLIAKKGKR